MKSLPFPTVVASLVFALTLSLAGCSEDPAQAGTSSRPSSTVTSGDVSEDGAGKPSGRPESRPMAAESKIEDIEVTAAAALLESDATVKVLDIRTQGEFATGHIKGAINIDFYGDDFKTKIAVLDKSAKYLMHCQSGGRSGKSLATFKKLGFANVLHLRDGMGGWKAGGHPVEK